MKKGRAKAAKRQSRRDRNGWWQALCRIRAEWENAPPPKLLGTFKGVPVFGYETMGTTKGAAPT